MDFRDMAQVTQDMDVNILDRIQLAVAHASEPDLGADVAETGAKPGANMDKGIHVRRFDVVVDRAPLAKARPGPAAGAFVSRTRRCVT